MPDQKEVVPGTPEWENICEQCGLCCLEKYCDMNGDVHMTRVLCDMCDSQTHKCLCYNVDIENRGAKVSGCMAVGGRRLTQESLRNDYLVPGFCPYVKAFVAPNDLVRPDLSGVDFIHQSEQECGLRDYVIPDTDKYFKYNPHTNKFLKEVAIWLRQKKTK